jgi:hypothetical protein
MSNTSKIKMLEESYRMIETQISNLEKSDSPDKDKLSSLYETKNKYLMQLRELRRLDYEDSQRVEFDDR